MIETSKVNRRRFLRGTSIALALPSLNSLAGSESDNANSPRRLVCIGNHLGFYPGNFFPQTGGKDHVQPSTLKPLEAHKNEFTVFSNLDHELNGGHKAVQGFLNGIKKEEAAGFPAKNMSLDQAAAEHVGSKTRFPSINTGITDGTDMCWTRTGVHIPPINNPATLYQALFIQSSKSEREAERTRLTYRASILDALRGSASALNRKLNAADRNKLDQYLTSVREVERQLQMSNEWLNKPKPNSPIDEIHDEERQHLDEVGLFYDLMALALQSDSTRVATFETGLGFRTTELNLGSYHQISHHGKSDDRIEQLQVIEAFLAGKLSNFITRLKESGIFDDTLIVFGSGMSDASTHSNRNLPVLLAGGGVQHQGHLICPDRHHERIPLSNLWLSVLHWFGSDAERFGRSTGTFSPMKLA